MERTLHKVCTYISLLTDALHIYIRTWRLFLYICVCIYIHHNMYFMYDIVRFVFEDFIT